MTPSQLAESQRMDAESSVTIVFLLLNPTEGV